MTTRTRWIGALRNDSAMYVPQATSSGTEVMPWATQYAVLDSYYSNNGLYESLSSMLGGTGYRDESIRGLRNPTAAVISFYASKLWPGKLPEALPIETDNESLLPVIEQIWEWSNWQSIKQQVARTFPKFGDMFLKISTKRNAIGSDIKSVYIESLPPQSVTKMESDERGYLTYLRLDTPTIQEDADGKEKTFIVTEEWNKATQAYRRWIHDKGSDTPINRLSGLELTLNFTTAWGHDFIPIVWQGFRLTGGERGEAAITPAIDKIDEVNRQATALHKNMFRYNKPTTIVGRDGNDASGRPLPPVSIGASGTLSLSTNPDEENIWILPGATTVSSLVPNLNYADHVLTIDKMMDNLMLDLPEIVYSMLHTIGGNPSSVSLQTLLLAATDRLLEARQNAESALIRAHQIAVSIGQYAGLFDSSIGNYDDGALSHTFANRPVWSRSELEIAQTMQAYKNAGVPVEVSAMRAGWSEQEVNDLTKVLDEQMQQQLDINAQKANQALSQLRAQPGRVERPVTSLNGAGNK
jgi:hypothetical protein